MKSLWSWLAKILLVVALVEGWFIYSFYTDKQALLVEKQDIASRLQQSEQNLSAANEKIAQMERDRLEGRLRETNKAIVSGWEQLLDTVEGELQKARKSIPALLGKDTGGDDEEGGSYSPTNPETAPGAEGPGADGNSEEPSTPVSPGQIPGERT